MIMTAREVARAVRTGAQSPTELVEDTLDRAARLGPEVGAFVTLTPELALRQAAEVERQLKAGEELPALAGVPCPIKDLTQVAGVPIRRGSAALAGDPAPVDDGVVTLLRQAGTIMVGKTSTPEFGLPPYTEPDVAPPARTPWDLSRSAGGSSGGAAAAVAAGIVPIAHASDGGGSIRIPASCCGLVGLKPSRGRISPGPYGAESAGLSTHGVVTRDVRDTALALDLLAHDWPGDAFIAPPGGPFLDACAADPGSLRIGLILEPFYGTPGGVDPVCRAAAEQTAELLTELGHRVDVGPAPMTAEAQQRGLQAFEALWAISALGAPVPADAEDRVTPLTRHLREVGRGVTGLQFAQAVQTAQLITRAVADRWQAYDLILTPTLAQPPMPIGGLRNDLDPVAEFVAQYAYTPWTNLANVTGRPSISLPLHRAEVGGTTLPIGVMLTGRYGADAMIISVAAQLEQARPWPTEPRPVHRSEAG
ncbi:amidase [Microlunatus parietis]|uniref:Amidase n=2 Tax=Microlunatus parietis TaxID=682979 RepID=A0A7Y9L8D7_9ACTN|nr:amidase [Microlunatus parietis]